MDNIIMRDSETAFKNAINKGLMTKPDDYMYMYSKSFDNGVIHDVFKHIETRHYETVKIEPEMPDFNKAINYDVLDTMSLKDLNKLNKILSKIDY